MPLGISQAAYSPSSVGDAGYVDRALAFFTGAHIVSKQRHTIAPISSAALAASLQSSAATSSTSSSTNCSKSGLAIKSQKDTRGITTTAVPITTGGGGTITIAVINDTEDTVT